MRIFIKAAILLLVFVVENSVAMPFDSRGYRQCMTIDQVQEVAKNSNHRLSIMGPKNEMAGGANYLIFQNEVLIGNLYTWKNRLDMVTWDFSGGIEAMVKQLNYLSKEGYKKEDSNWKSQLFYDGRESFSLDIYLTYPKSKKDFYVEVGLNAISGNVEPTGHVSWNSRSHYCK
jgi:hypothetical protein